MIIGGCGGFEGNIQVSGENVSPKAKEVQRITNTSAPPILYG